MLLALDWRKAFDSIAVDGLVDALRRFGIPQDIITMIRNMLNSRLFYVEECGSCSSSLKQRSRISQGCTLSPLLFVIVMTVVLHDAVSLLSPAAKRAYDDAALADLIYADDTLLIGVSAAHVNEYLRHVAAVGAQYGMELHWQKFQLLPVRASPSIVTPTGETVPPKESLAYLGAVLAADGKHGNELCRRIGCAKAAFNALAKLWSHSSLTWKGKLRVYSSLVESKLLYSLSSMCLTAAERRQLNGFQNRCLRQLIGVKPSYVSRVSNAEVIARTGHTLATNLLLRRQLQLFGKILRSPAGHPLRDVSFIPGTTFPATSRYVRRRGRPCKEWVPEMIGEAVKMFGSMQATEEAAQNKHHWDTCLKILIH